MKITSYLARFAAAALVAFSLGVTVGHGVLVLFSLSAGAVVLLAAAGDYAPRRTATCTAFVVARRSRETMPLAA